MRGAVFQRAGQCQDSSGRDKAGTCPAEVRDVLLGGAVSCQEL